MKIFIKIIPMRVCPPLTSKSDDDGLPPIVGKTDRFTERFKEINPIQEEQVQQPERGWHYKSPEKQNKLKKINFEDNSEQHENYINEESQVDNVTSQYMYEVVDHSWTDYSKSLKEEDIESLGPGK